MHPGTSYRGLPWAVRISNTVQKSRIRSSEEFTIPCSTVCFHASQDVFYQLRDVLLNKEG